MLRNNTRRFTPHRALSDHKIIIVDSLLTARSLARTFSISSFKMMLMSSGLMDFPK